MFRSRRVVMLLLLVTAIALGLACGSDNSGNPVAPNIKTVPANWGGIWKVTFHATDCSGAGAFDSTITDTLTICPGDSILDSPMTPTDSSCTNGTFTATATNIGISCSGTYNEQGCRGTSSFSMTLHIDGTAGTQTGSGRLSLHPTSGTNCKPVCVDFTISGVRIGPPPVPCVAGKPRYWRKLAPVGGLPWPR